MKPVYQNKKIFFIGIKGTGISGLAILLKQEGAFVSGSDTEEEFPSEIALKKENIEVKIFNPENITPELDLIIYSSAYTGEHPERKKAKELGIKEKSYAEALEEYSRGRKVIVVTGTHGKTTTTALLGQIFEAAGLDPAVLVGDIVRVWENSIRSGKGEYFIIEGDEYQEKFRLFKPAGILIPALDWDHPDYFKTPKDYLNSFESWLRENPEAKVVRDFDKIDEEIFKKARFILPGEHYRRNCLMSIKLSRLFGIRPEDIIKGINAFKGVRRRLDFYTPEDSEILIIYDYAHHPLEIQATLKALSEKYPKHKMIAVFQPHTYSRTKTFLNDFAKSFSKADEVYFEEIYASAREKEREITIEDLVRETQKHHPKARHIRELEINKLKANKLKTILIFMGAGDIWQKARALAESIVSK